MNFKNILYAVFLTVLVIAGSTGCKKGHFDINQNPNQPTDSTVSYDVVLPAALDGTGALVARNWGWLQNWLGYWARSGTYAPNVTEETYQITTTFQNAVWNDLYNNLYDYDVVIKKSQQAGLTADFYQGIARIMKAHNYALLVDIYNNVPYQQSLKGNGNITPAYDAGVDIYKDLFRQIDTGIALIKGAVTDGKKNKGIETNDIMFGTGDLGDVDNQKHLWAKLGNTLKLRFLVHAFKVPAISVSAEIAKITAEGSGFLMAGEDAQVNPGYRSDKQTPFYESYVADATGAATANSVYYKANEYGIKFYQFDADPRTSRFYAAGSGGLVGVKYGLPPITANAASVLAGIGPGLTRTNTAPAWVVTATESLFLQAEAIERKFIPGDAKAVLEDAMIESFTFVGVPDAAHAADDYIASGGTYAEIDYDQSVTEFGSGIFTIISQKWFALNGIAPYEVWTDLRRTDIVIGNPNGSTGYVAGPPISVAPQNTATKIPIRLLYPQTEYNYNSGNVGKEGTIDQFTSKIFWDIN